MSNTQRLSTTDERDAGTRIRLLYPTMHKTRRRIADYILEYPEVCSFLSLKDIAQKTNTSQVTVLSFCSDLGFNSYVDFKQSLQSSLIGQVGMRERLKLMHVVTHDEADLYNQLIKSSHKIIDDTSEANSVETVLAFSRQLCNSKHIFAVGHNVTAGPAKTLVNNLIAQNIDARLLDIQNRDEVFQLLTKWPVEECTLVAFGISPCGKSTIAISDFCKKIGMTVMCVTDKASSQLIRSSSVSLVCSVVMMSIFNSLTSIYMMTDIINSFIALEIDRTSSPEVQSAESKRAGELQAMFDNYFLG